MNQYEQKYIIFYDFAKLRYWRISFLANSKSKGFRALKLYAASDIIRIF